MTKKQFLKENREAINTAVIRAGGRRPTNDEERWDWVMNDEGLYNWARSEGVKV